MLSDPVRVHRPDAPDHFMDISPLDGFVAVSVVINGSQHEVALSGRALQVIEVGYDPVLYVPQEDIVPQLLSTSLTTTQCPLKGQTRYFHLDVWGARFSDIAWSYTNVLDFDDNLKLLTDRVAFDNQHVVITSL